MASSGAAGPGLAGGAAGEAMGLEGLRPEGLLRMRQTESSELLKKLRLKEGTWSCLFILQLHSHVTWLGELVRLRPLIF